MSEPNSLLIDIATHNVFCLPDNGTAGDAASLMAERRISSIVVTDGAGHPAGIVTERNILQAMQSGHRQEKPLRDIMSSPVITVPVSITVLDAYRLCQQRGLRHLVIVDGKGMLAGVASETDFRLHLNLTALAGRRKVATVAKRSALVLPPGTALPQALGLMLAQQKSCVVVIEDRRPVGIVTERDVVRFFSNAAIPEGITLGDVMVAPVLTIPEDASTSQAAEMMLARRLRHLVVVDSAGHMAGLVSEHDLTQIMAAGQTAERAGIEENFLRTLVNTLPDLVWLKDKKGIYLACNARFERFFGANERDIVGKSDYDFVDRELADFFREHDRKAMEKNEPSVNEEWVTFADDGHRELLETIKMPMRDADDKLVGVLGIARNITARRQTEDALRFIAQRGGMDNAENILSGIAQYIGTALDVDYALVDKLSGDDGMAETVALYAKGGMAPNIRYALKGSPCDNVVGKALCCYRRGVQALFPEDRLLAEMGIESYAGIPLWDAAGRAIGLIAVMDGKPFSDEAAVTSLLQLMAARAASELERARSEQLLREQKEFLDAVFENALDAVVLMDEKGVCTHWNRQAEALFDWARDEAVGRPIHELIVPERHRKAHVRGMEHFRESGKGPVLNTRIEITALRRDGSEFPVELSITPIRTANGHEFSSFIRDISERRRAEENLRINASVFDTSQEAILITNADNAIVDVNPAFTRITGYRREEVLGRNPGLLSSGRHDQAFYDAMWRSIAEEKAWRGEIWNRRKSGEIYAELLSISAICDAAGRVQRHVGVFSDISHIKAHEAELSRVAHYDALTGIPNRVLLADRMRQAIIQSVRERNMVAVCYLDLDGFKRVNDTMGHEAGDHVLIEISRRIEHTIRGGDTVARLGGDEFVVLLQGLEKGEECAATLERLLAAISQPIQIKDQPCILSASIGVGIYPLDDEDPDTLLRHADQAMYVAKQSGKNRFHIYDPALDLRARNHHEFLCSIRRGLEQGQFELHYQPKINLRTRQLAGAEALIRWHHPERGLLAPAEFLRMIENTPLDIRIGDWVIATALKQIERWRDTGLDIGVSINISAYHLESPHFAEKLRQQLECHPGVAPGKLQVEVLETSALENISVVRKVIEDCRRQGVRFALDDFGTGYSSLSYLSSLPVDALKIDQSFVRDMLDDKNDLAIVHGVIALAQALEREIVAEGIETGAHYQALLDLGCEFGQGYGISRPMPADQLTGWRFE